MKKLEKAFEVIEHTDAMLAFWDKDLICRFANASYLKWFGLSPSDMIDKMTLPELLGPLYHLNFPYINKALKGKLQVFERDITLANGETKNTIATYTPEIKNGIVIGFYVHVADISKVKNASVKINEQADDFLTMSVAHNYLNGVEYTLRTSLFTKFPGISSLAKKYFISQTKLKKDFKIRYNKTIFSYYRFLQMQVAHKYIKGKIYSKIQLAEMFKFENPSNFSNCYKKYYPKLKSDIQTWDNGYGDYSEKTFQSFPSEKEGYNPLNSNKSKDDVPESKLEIWNKYSEIFQIGSWERDFETMETKWDSIIKNILELTIDFEPDKSPALNFYKEGVNRERAKKCLDDAFTKGKSFDFQALLITAKGNEKKVRVLGFCKFENGACKKIIGTMQEIH